ncbi:hypothetical protein C8R48DRAFT_771462 [Suillus tomentosus]|nr:hypothetical protein C8R48DRAFT_771462 [Suillus tomentosus]
MSDTSTDTNSRSSSFNDGAEAILIAAGLAISTFSSAPGSCTPETPHSQHSHDYYPCHGGQAHGQGLPSYSCGCYRRTYRRTEVVPAFALANALADVSEHQGLQRDVDSLSTQDGGHSSDSKFRPLKRKRSMTASESVSVGGTTPRCFGQNLTNVQRAQSVPALEAPKRRKLGKPFEFDGTHETSTLNAVKRLEAAIDRQTEVLSKIYRVLEGSAK